MLLAAAWDFSVDSLTCPKMSLYGKVLAVGVSWQLLYIKANQINQPTQRPTLRWVFQLLEGIHRVRVGVQGQMHDFIEGLTQVQIKILRLFGQDVCQIYQIS